MYICIYIYKYIYIYVYVYICVYIDIYIYAQAPKAAQLMQPWESKPLLLGNLHLQLIMANLDYECQTNYKQY